jgi:hypothetical protein
MLHCGITRACLGQEAKRKQRKEAQMQSIRRKMPGDPMLERYGPRILQGFAIAAALAILIPVAIVALTPIAG